MLSRSSAASPCGRPGCPQSPTCGRTPCRGALTRETGGCQPRCSTSWFSGTACTRSTASPARPKPSAQVSTACGTRPVRRPSTPSWSSGGAGRTTGSTPSSTMSNGCSQRRGRTRPRRQSSSRCGSRSPGGRRRSRPHTIATSWRRRRACSQAAARCGPPRPPSGGWRSSASWGGGSPRRQRPAAKPAAPAPPIDVAASPFGRGVCLATRSTSDVGACQPRGRR